jgi:hypothetical protein
MNIIYFSNVWHKACSSKQLTFINNKTKEGIMKKEITTEEALFIIPKRFFSCLMIILFGISICATYADARIARSLESMTQYQPKSPTNIFVYVLPDMDKIQIRWHSDDHTITGYAIYKNGILFDTSSHPFYIDNWPKSEPGPVYEITAFDIFGTESSACKPFRIR